MKKDKMMIRIENKNLLKSFDIPIIKAYDFDGTLFEPIGTYEQDYDLEKFKKDNTFFKNLFTEELPLAEELRKAKKRGNIIYIITAREWKWWFPLLLWLKNIPYDEIRQRPKARENISTHKLKKEQLIELISKYGNSYELDFYDDSSLNCNEIEQGIKYAVVHKV